MIHKLENQLRLKFISEQESIVLCCTFCRQNRARNEYRKFKNRLLTIVKRARNLPRLPSRHTAIWIMNYVKLTGTEGTKLDSIARRGEQRGDESNNKLIRITPPGYIRDQRPFDAVLRPPFPMTTHCYGTRLTFSPSNVEERACMRRHKETGYSSRSFCQVSFPRMAEFFQMSSVFLCNDNITKRSKNLSSIKRLLMQQ